MRGLHSDILIADDVFRAHVDQLFHSEQLLCLPGNALPSLCPPPGFPPVIPLLTFFPLTFFPTFFPLAIPDRNAYKNCQR
jgi:hypothetical protein